MSDIDPTLGFELRSLEPGDVDAVLAIIETHDAEDAEAARASYSELGIDGMFVATQGEHILGITGARSIDVSDRAYWLSWTYLSADAEKAGLAGKVLLLAMLDELVEVGARKVFAMVGVLDEGMQQDAAYRDPTGPYLEAGFTVEATTRDYYDRYEHLTILGKRIQDERGGAAVAPDHSAAVIVDVDEIVETEDAYFIAWELDDEGGEGSSAELIEAAVSKARKWKGRVVFVGVPSDLPTVQAQFQRARFREEGKLLDFYEDGIHEIRMRLELQ